MENIYDFSNPEKAILFSGPFCVEVNSKKYIGDGDAFIELRRQSSIVLSIKIAIKAEDWADFQDYFAVRIYHDNVLLDFFVTNCTLKPDYSVTIRSVAKEDPLHFAGNSLTVMDKVIANFINLNYFCSHRLVLESAPWKVIFTPCIDGQKEREIIYDGGYALTHQAEILTSSGQDFTGKNVSTFLDFFRFFLFFVTGNRHTAVSPVGFKNSKCIWSQWGSPFARFNPIHTWFSRKYPEILIDVFPKFYSSWNNGWEKTFREACNWYVIANDSENGIDAGTIVAQAALERLSFDYFVTNGSLSDEAYKKTYRIAEQKIDGILTSLNIPTIIPVYTPKLSTFSSVGNAIAQVRNDIVHPRKNLPLDIETAEQAWRLSVYCLELIILAICGYRGKFGNRLDAHRYEHVVESVPWT